MWSGPSSVQWKPPELNIASDVGQPISFRPESNLGIVITAKDSAKISRIARSTTICF
jgi:hypothetical protein